MVVVSPFLERLGLSHPIFQAPMAGVSTPAMAAAVSNAGGLGALGLGSSNADGARLLLRETRALTQKPINANFFVHAPAKADAAKEAAWLKRLAPDFARLGATPPTALREIYTSFLADEAMLAMLLEEKPEIVSFHFGLPREDQARALRVHGIALVTSATSLAEAEAAARAGMDAIVAQGYEAGGHRGVFDPDAPDDKLSAAALTRILVKNLDLPVIMAGGIMDGAGIAAALDLGAAAAQLGTAFVTTPESGADSGYREALLGAPAHHTTLTRAISGRPARSLANRFTALGESVDPTDIPAYPIAYDAGKALHTAARARGEFGYGAQWAGQGAPLARPMPTAKLMETLISEYEAARQRQQ